MSWRIRKIGFVKEIILTEIKHTSDYHMETHIFVLNDDKDKIICRFDPRIKVGDKVEVIGEFSNWYKMFHAHYVRWLNPQTKLTQFKK